MRNLNTKTNVSRNNYSKNKNYRILSPKEKQTRKEILLGVIGFPLLITSFLCHFPKDTKEYYLFELAPLIILTVILFICGAFTQSNREK